MNTSNILFAMLILVVAFVGIHFSSSSFIDAARLKNNIINTIIDDNSSTGIVTTKDTPLSLPGAAYAQPLKNNNNNSDMIITAKLEDPFQLTINQTAVIAANNMMSMQFLDVPEDSRCPSFVECIWAGQVMVSLNVSEISSVPLIFNLTLGPSPSNSSARSVDTLIIQLLQVEPYPIREEEIAKSDYRATFLISER
jgi:hypothetical protein